MLKHSGMHSVTGETLQDPVMIVCLLCAIHMLGAKDEEAVSRVVVAEKVNDECH